MSKPDAVLVVSMEVAMVPGEEDVMMNAGKRVKIEDVALS